MKKRGSGTPVREKATARRAWWQRSEAILLAYAVLALLVWPVFPHYGSPNEFSRWALTASLVEHRSTSVTWLETILEGNEDLARGPDGELRSNKAPGSSFAAMPAYAAARMIFGPPDGATMRPVLSIIRFWVSTVPLLLLAWRLITLARRHGAREEDLQLASAALLFGTPLCAYGLLFFSHALVAWLLFEAWCALAVDDRPWTGGACLGLAAITEYPAALPAALLVLVCAWKSGWRSAVIAMSGGIPFAALLAVYNKAAFGGPFALSSGFEQNEAFRELASRGVFGVAWPTAEGLLGVLFDPSKGLLILSPILLAALPGWKQVRDRFGVPATAGLAGAAVIMILVYAGYPNWHGGQTVGVRYLVPVLPLALFPLCFVHRNTVSVAATAASATAIVPLSLVFPFVNPDVPFPWGSFSWPLLRDGLLAPNLFHLAGAWPGVILPLAICAAAVAIPMRLKPGAAVTGVVLMIALGAIGARQIRDSRDHVLREAVVRAIHFGDQTALDRAAQPLPPIVFRFRDAMMQRPPSEWSFR